MEEENFTFLTFISELECKVVCQRLEEANIKYLIKSPPEGAYWSLYGAKYPSTGKEIYVRASDIEKARELLGIDKQGLSMSKWKFGKLFRIFILVCLIIWILLIILSTVSTLL